MAGELFLLDTNAISEIRKRRPDPAALAFLRSLPRETIHLSVLTLGELRRGDVNKHRRHPGMSSQYGSWIDGLEVAYKERILPIDHAIGTLWGQLTADRSRPVVDTLLAATAIIHNLTLVTRNTKDVAGLPVKLVNPWLT
jgi:predicted nucleic acid-binding protein